MPKFDAVATTTDGLPVTLAEIPVPPETVISINVTIVGRRVRGTAGSREDGALYQVKGCYRNIDGVMLPVGQLISPDIKSNLGSAALVMARGSHVAVQVRGADLNEYAWRGQVEWTDVSTIPPPPVSEPI